MGELPVAVRVMRLAERNLPSDAQSDARSARVQLSLVFRRIEMACRFGYQALGCESRLFEAADTDTITRAAQSRMGTGQRPVISDLRILHGEFVGRRCSVWRRP